MRGSMRTALNKSTFLISRKLLQKMFDATTVTRAVVVFPPVSKSSATNNRLNLSKKPDSYAEVHYSVIGKATDGMVY